MSSQVFNISEDGDSTTLLGNLFQYLTTTTGERVLFLRLHRISCVSICAYYLSSFHWIQLLMPCEDAMKVIR